MARTVASSAALDLDTTGLGDASQIPAAMEGCAGPRCVRSKRTHIHVMRNTAASTAPAPDGG
eukprot:2823119-Lingulodinium_polyedra.AAC.1